MSTCSRDSYLRALWLVLGLGIAMLAGRASAFTLDPDHRVWQGRVYDRDSLREAYAQLQSEQLSQKLKQTDTGKVSWSDARILVLPVFYSDGTAPDDLSRQNLEERFFGSGESSVRAFFETTSGGECQVTGAVLDWQQLPQELRIYRNVLDGGATSPFLAGPRLLVRDAVRVAAPLVDLSMFDGDGLDGLFGSGDDDGFVDLLLVLHPDAGFESTLNPVGPAMLAHQSFLSVRDDQLAGEPAMARNYVVASAQGPLGVWVHELGHLLGLEDLYNLNSSATPEDAQGGLGIWSLMASGTWGGGGEAPSGLDAYSRRRLGWDQLVELEAGQNFRLPPSSTGVNRSAKIQPLGPWGREHFLVEVRSPSGGVVDSALPGTGALVYHVDPGVPNAAGASHSTVTILQADGRDDLGNQVNDGDATDPFPQPGVDEINGFTVPSTRSFYAGTDLITPVIRFSAAPADSVDISWQLHESGGMRLVSAQFDDGAAPPREHLLPLERAPWRLLFEASGNPLTAEIRAIQLPDSVALFGANPLSLVQTPLGWEPVTAWELEAQGSGTSRSSAELLLELSVDGAAPRSISVGIPVGGSSGLASSSFASWSSLVLSTGPNPTSFRALLPGVNPPTAQSGFELENGGTAGYNNGADCALLSPWFAVDNPAEFKLWSSSSSEQAADGHAWDGGILEILQPDLGWIALIPEGGPTISIRPGSAASTRGRRGFGGRFVGWTSYTAMIPEMELPVRARLRFGSDASFRSGHWAVADGGTTQAPLDAALTLQVLGGGHVEVGVVLSGEISGIAGEIVRLAWRRPHEDSWRFLSASHTVDPLESVFSLVDQIPTMERVLSLGVIVESAAVADLELGRIGYRAATSSTTLELSPNPASGEVQILLETSLATAHLDLYDYRGRLLRTLFATAPVRGLRWDGRDADGAAVAAGAYIIVLREQPEVHRKLTWLP